MPKLPLPSASGIMSNESGCIAAVDVYESTGLASATFILWDGSSSAGVLATVYTLSAGQSARDTWRLRHKPIQTGLYFQLVNGAVVGSVMFLPGAKYASDPDHDDERLGEYIAAFVGAYAGVHGGI